ncbi:MAG: cell division protein ZapB [Treponema sp.]|nr:cell division protein ZapB [Treponema sp.]
MISLDQVLLLEQKVESAVEKIKQLEGENAALRNKCSELTNALSAKTEQLTAFESEQKTIESGIIKAIDRLNSIEHSVLKKAGSIAEAQPEPIEEPVEEEAPVPVTEMSFEQMMPVAEPEEPPFEEVPIEEPVEESEEVVEDDAESDPESKDQLGFDIF